MKKNKYFVFAAVFMSAITPLDAQISPEYRVGLYGFARADYVFDTRQMMQAREEQMDLYPLDIKRDANGKDVNAAGASNFLSIASRIGVRASGPEVFGAKPSALIEADFYGNTNANTGLLYLRQAYATLSWEKTTVLLGQTWYPASVQDVFPGVVNFNAGTMFNPFGRAPQIRVTQKMSNDFYGEIAAYKTSSHPPVSLNANANDASTNSLIPILHANVRYKHGHFTAGIGAEYQSLKPLTVYNNLATDEKVKSSMFFGYFKYENSKFTAKAYALKGGNLYHMMMLGGFDDYSSTAGIVTYKPIEIASYWVDLATVGNNVTPGIFLGYTENLGADSGFKNVYGRGVSATRAISRMFRTSARIELKQNKFRFAPEFEYTSAVWKDNAIEGKPAGNSSTVGNFRILLNTQYNF